jgi:poly-gamma-glutamate capsule biosynthesis protein CapA/YwtB (metallophosphatase superfamily)
MLSSLVIRATGDVNLDPEYVSGLRDRGFSYAWSGLAGFLRGDDLTIVNLECAVSKLGHRQVKSYTFRGDPAALGPMRAAGVEVANLANNHSLDFGAAAMLDSRANLLANGIEPVGAGRNEAEAMRPLLVRVKGRTVAVLGFTQIVPTTDWYATASRPGVARGDDTRAMTAAVAAAQARADVVVVTIHWGIERATRPTAAQMALAKALIDAGADAIFGHHPHVLQPLSFYAGRPIFYSLGNFVWRRSFEESYDTGIAEVTVAADGPVTARLVPARIEASGHPVLRG